MVYLVVVGYCDPMVLAINLSPVQLARKGGDMRFCSVSPWREEVVFDSQFLLGSDNIPRADLGNQCLDCLVCVPYLCLLEFLTTASMALTDTKSTTSWKVYSFHSAFWSAWN